MGAPSIDEVLAAATPRRETLRLSLRGDLAERHSELVQALSDAQRDEAGLEAQPRSLEIADQIRAVEAEIRETATEFVVAPVGKLAWRMLLDANPPTDEQLVRFPRIDHNPEKFPYAAIAASVTAPTGLTVDRVQDLEERLTDGEWDRLWATVLRVNVGVRQPGESRAASAVIERLRPSSEQPANGKSPAASS